MMTTKRMRRDSMRVATDGIAATNPIPFAIPILREMVIPPDKPSGRVSMSSSPFPLIVSSSSAANASEALDLRNVVTVENERKS